MVTDSAIGTSPLGEFGSTETFSKLGDDLLGLAEKHRRLLNRGLFLPASGRSFSSAGGAHGSISPAEAATDAGPNCPVA